MWLCGVPTWRGLPVSHVLGVTAPGQSWWPWGMMLPDFEIQYVTHKIYTAALMCIDVPGLTHYCM